MNVKQTLAISQKECFELIIDSVLYDIKKITNQSLSIKTLAGYTYKRPMSNGVTAATEITEVTPDALYQFTTKTRLNKHITTYNIGHINKNSCEVTYSEKVEAETALQKLNNLLTQLMFGFFRKKRIKNLLKAMEQSVISKNKLGVK